MTGWRLDVFDELESSSTACAARARAGEAEGLAVLALKQTAGRGSRGRAWQAPEGNLNLSVLLRPQRPAAEAGMFALLAGVAVAEALQALTGLTPTLKWPNDLLLDGAKLGGILIDAASAGDRLDWLVIGIGVNLRAAPVIGGRKTIALGEKGAELAAETAARAILERLGQWRDAPAAAITAAWLARGHEPGTPIMVCAGEERWQGRFAGLSPRGELRLHCGDRIELISTGEVLLGPS